MSWVRLVVLLEVRDRESHIEVPDVLDWHHFVELLLQTTKSITYIISICHLKHYVNCSRMYCKLHKTDTCAAHSEVLLLEGMLWEFRQRDALVLHFSKQLNHHGGQII